MPGTITVFLLNAALVAGVLVYSYVRKGRERVLGQPSADGRKEEAARLSEEPAGPSPMPEGRYGQRRGEWGLVNPEPLELDRLLRELCVSFAAKPVPEQTGLRSAVSTDESYTLLCFARQYC